MYPCHVGMWLIRPGRVLHKRLQDFTLGHAYLLEAMDSPFVVGGKISMFDLVAAVLVCSMPFAKARKYLMQPLSKIRKDAELWGFWCRLRGFDMQAEIAKFRAYINAYTESPEAWIKQGEKTRKTCLPTSVRLAWVLMQQMGEDAAWNCPMARALAYFTAHSEYNGQEYMTEAEARKVGLIDG